MLSVEEMIKLLSDEYGITSEKQLDEEIRKLGGIRIDVFTKSPSDCSDDAALTA